MKKLNKLEVLASIENGNDDFRVTVETAEDNGFKIFEKDFSSQEQYEEWIEDNDLEISIHDAEIDDNTTDVVFRPRIEGISCQDLIIINFPGGYYERYKGMEWIDQYWKMKNYNKEYFQKKGRKGGQKSRRKLTSEQAREMALKSAESRRNKKKEKDKLSDT